MDALEQRNIQFIIFYKRNYPHKKQVDLLLSYSYFEYCSADLMVQWFMAMLKSARCCVRANVRYSTEVAQSPLTSGRQWHWTQCALSGRLVSTELRGDTPAIIVAAAVSRSRHGGSVQAIGEIHYTIIHFGRFLSFMGYTLIKLEDPYKNLSLFMCTFISFR